MMWMLILGVICTFTISFQNVNGASANCKLEPCPKSNEVSIFCAYNSTNYRTFTSCCEMNNYNCLNKNKSPYTKFVNNETSDCPSKEECDQIRYVRDPTLCAFNGTHYNSYYGSCYLDNYNCYHPDECPYKYVRDGSCDSNVSQNEFATRGGLSPQVITCGCSKTLGCKNFNTPGDLEMANRGLTDSAKYYAVNNPLSSTCPQPS